MRILTTKVPQITSEHPGMELKYGTNVHSWTNCDILIAYMVSQNRLALQSTLGTSHIVAPSAAHSSPVLYHGLRLVAISCHFLELESIHSKFASKNHSSPLIKCFPIKQAAQSSSKSPFAYRSLERMVCQIDWSPLDSPQYLRRLWGEGLLDALR